MGSFSIWHWLVVLLIVILVFGTRKLTTIGKDLGSAVRGFKEGMAEENQSSSLPFPIESAEDETTLQERMTNTPPPKQEKRE